MPKNRGDKPKGRMSSYAYFVQCCREEHKKKHPGENVVFGEFTKKCAGKWKEMTPKEKKRFEDMADKDKIRYQKEMADFTPDNPKAGGRAGKKRTKDPNAPKRALSAFFLFCNEERPKVRKDHSGWSVGEVAKELGKRWEKQHDKSKFEALADIERKKYEKNMAAYKAGLQQEATAKSKASPAKKARVEKVEVDDEDDDDDDDEEEEEEEDDDDDDE